MLHKLLIRTMSLLMIAQAIVMFVAQHTSIQILSDILIVESIAILSIAPWLFKKAWYICIALMLTSIGILLSEYFLSLKVYYTWITLIPLITGIILLVSSYRSKKISGDQNK